MEIKTRITGNVVSIKSETKPDGTIYHVVNVASDISKDKSVYTTLFIYGMSEKRAELLTRGSLISAYGNYSDNLYINPKIVDEVVSLIDLDQETGEFKYNSEEISQKIYDLSVINKILNVKDLDILYSKKE